MAAKSLMVLGTMSSAGKSFVTAGLCRIFRQDGYRTAPFKSQNMALNSYITADGMEMGRAQVMQAEAAGIAPDVRMNPILLKPTSDSGSQVIVNGEIYGTMRAQEYYTKKQELIPYILKAYRALAAENDIIVLEGAGSPAEINLKSVDIVNLGMAELSDSPAILVGDIDRGGVFASLYGTIMLLDDAERRRIRGIVINKFRGDVEILKSGLTMLEELTGICRWNWTMRTAFPNGFPDGKRRRNLCWTWRLSGFPAFPTLRISKRWNRWRACRCGMFPDAVNWAHRT